MHHRLATSVFIFFVAANLENLAYKLYNEEKDNKQCLLDTHAQ